MNEAHQFDPAVEPLQNVLGYLTEIIRLDERIVERLPDHQLTGGHCFVLHQHELDGLPGVTRDTFDDAGPVWLAVERLSAIDPPVTEPDLGIWIQAPANPEQRPLVRDNVVIAVDGREKDRLIAAKAVRAEDCAPAIAADGASGIWSVRLRLEQRPDLAARIDGYVTGPWTAWAEAERPRRRTMAIYQRLREIAQFVELGGTDRTCEIVWGIGVSRWRHHGHDLDLPLLERLVEIEVIESPGAEIRIRPRIVGAIVNLQAIEALSPGAAPLARDSAGRMLEAIERGGELSPFARESFEPILSVISSQLDPRGSYLPGHGSHQLPLPDAGDNLVVSDRWAIFARPRSSGFVLRDIERLKDAIGQTSTSACCLSGAAGVLLPGPSNDEKAAARRALSGVIGRPIDIEPGPQAEPADHGDVFFPLPASPDQVDIVRQLERSDGLVVQGPRGADRTDAIANVICHYLALGLRVLVVSRNGPGLAMLRERLPRAIRDLTVSLTATDKVGLRQAETVVSRLQSIVETQNLHDQVAQINHLEREIITTRQEISRIDEEAADVVGSNLRQLSGFSDLPFDPVRVLLADRDGHSWFVDRPTRFLTKTDLLVPAADLARDARVRLCEDLKYIDDKLPAVTDLPDAATLVRLHEDLQRSVHASRAESRDCQLARHAVATLGVEAVRQLAIDLDALAAAHRVIAEEPWLAPLSPLGKGEASTDAELIVDFARDASFQLSRRAGFLARPAEAPADAFTNKELLDILDRLAAGKKVFSAFAWQEKKLKPVIDSLMVAGLAPSAPDDWAHVRDYLIWRRDLCALNARWRSLAPEISAPALVAESSQTFHGLERITKSVEAATITAALARRNVTAAAQKLSVPDSEIEAMLGDFRRLEALGAAVKNAATRLAGLGGEVARLEQMFSGTGAVATFVRGDVLSRIGSAQVESQQIEASWTSVRAAIQSLHDRCEDFELIENVSRTMSDGGAPDLARRIRTETANRETGDCVLVADWAAAWNSAALMRKMEDLGQRERLRDLADQRQQFENRLRELFAAVIGARVHLGLAQSMSSAVRQALTVFMITLRKMAATCSGPAAGRLRRMAREALESCHEGIPCWIMPTWRVAEQLPARLGTFDLVVIDEASQSDLRELTAMLRGRKVLVTDEARQAEPNVTDIDSVKIERIEHAFLSGVPQAIRQFLLPGTSLCDFVKVMFPDRMIRLRGHLRHVDPVARPAPSVSARMPEPRPRVAAAAADSRENALAAPVERGTAPRVVAVRESYVIEDEMAKVTGQLALTRRAQPDRFGSIGLVAPIDGQAPRRISRTAIGDVRDGEGREAVRRRSASGAGSAGEDRSVAAARPDPPVPAPRREPGAIFAVVETEPRRAREHAPSEVRVPAEGRPADMASAPESRGEAAVVVAIPAPQARAEQEFARIEPTRLPARRPSGKLRPRSSGRRRMLAVVAAFGLLLSAAPIYWPLAVNRISASWGAAPTAQKVSDRIGLSRQISAIDNDRSGTSGGVPEAHAARAMLYQEDLTDPHGKRYTGSVTWRTEPEASEGAGQASTVMIKCNIEVEGQLSATMSLRRNSDEALPASHVIEVRFNLPDDELRSGVSTLKGIRMKANESARGAALAGQVAKVTPKYFMVALSGLDQDIKRNVHLLKDKSWFDIPIVYDSGTRAILAIEKGAPGERVFKEAFGAWGR